MKKMLICGGDGFLGRNAIEKFKDDYEIRAVDLKFDKKKVAGVDYIETDLTLAENVKRVMEGVDIVLQYAAVSTGIRDAIERPYLHVTDNVVMNSFLMREAFERQIEHFVFPSCTVMYNPSENAVKEDDFTGVLDENSAYFGGGGMKVYLENVCKFYAGLKDNKTRFTVMRQSNIYGPFDKFQLEKSHVFAATIAKVMLAEDGGKVLVWGDGSEKKDFVFAQDLMNFIEIALKKQQNLFELVNIGGGEAIAIKDLVQKVIDISGKKLEIEYDLTKPTRKVSLEIDGSRVRDIFGWEASKAIDDGISEVILWYNENLS